MTSTAAPAAPAAPRPRVLCADDKPSLLDLVRQVLGETCEVTTVADGAAALAALSAAPFDVVVTDVRMPGADGFAVLARARETDADLPVILLTAFASVPMAVDAIRAGAYDYLTKPFEPDELRRKVAHAAEVRRLRARTRDLERAVGLRAGPAGLVGRSPAMRALYDLIEKAKDRDVTVLLTGESGTGKEVVARAIHFGGARRERPFVPVHCGALPAALIESELFGHAKGAFTGAAQAKRGLVEEADGGTLFLDEVAQLPPDLQGKLNRLLQEFVVRRVGEAVERKVDVRVLAATNVDLAAAVAAGTFREDLYYRLAVFPVRLPPLRERGDDVALLAAHFLVDAAARAGKKLAGFSADALEVLLRWPWPGNVRELSNAVERAAILEDGAEVTTASLPAEIVMGRRAGAAGTPAAPDAPAALEPDDELAALTYRAVVERARARVTQDYLVALLRAFHGNVSRAAERAGIERESLHRLLRQHGLSADDFRKPEEP
jgi:two-component system response regulator HydG